VHNHFCLFFSEVLLLKFCIASVFWFSLVAKRRCSSYSPHVNTLSICQLLCSSPSFFVSKSDAYRVSCTAYLTDGSTSETSRRANTLPNGSGLCLDMELLHHAQVPDDYPYLGCPSLGLLCRTSCGYSCSRSRCGMYGPLSLLRQ
jgi:hypothetical protein